MSGPGTHTTPSPLSSGRGESRIDILQAAVFSPATSRAPSSTAAAVAPSEPELIAEIRREIARKTGDLSAPGKEILTRAMLVDLDEAKLKEVSKLADTMLGAEQHLSQVGQMIGRGEPSAPAVLEVNNAIAKLLESVRGAFFPTLNEGDSNSSPTVVFAFRRYRDELLKRAGVLDESEALVFDEIYQGIERNFSKERPWTERLQTALQGLAPIFEQSRQFATARTADRHTANQLEPFAGALKQCLHGIWGEALTPEIQHRIDEVGSKYLHYLQSLGSKGGPRIDDISAELKKAFGRRSAPVDGPDGNKYSVFDVLPRQLASYRLTGSPRLEEVEKLLVIYKEFSERKREDREVPNHLKELFTHFDKEIKSALKEGLGRELKSTITSLFKEERAKDRLQELMDGASQGDEEKFKQSVRWIYRMIMREAPEGVRESLKDLLSLWVRAVKRSH